MAEIFGSTVGAVHEAPSVWCSPKDSVEVDTSMLLEEFGQQISLVVRENR